MSRWRRIVQIVMLATFVALAVAAAWPARVPLVSTAWLVADPLVALVAIVSARTAWELAAWSLVLVAATAIVGRFFCGWLCPLGTILDATDTVVRAERPARDRASLGHRGRWKHYGLIAVLACSVFGVSAGLALDPLVLLTRTIDLVAMPLASWLGFGSVLLVRQLPGYGAFSAPLLETPSTYTWVTTTTLLFAAIVFLGRLERRFWCRNLCPTGALLALLGRFGIVRRRVADSACTSCGACAGACPTGAIPVESSGETRRGECTLCMRCQSVCPPAAVSFGVGGGRPAPDMLPGRRQALVALGAGIGAGLLAVGSSAAMPRPGNVIRPPGSLPEDEFLARCTRCLACAESCPTNALQPMGAEAGWEALWTPVLVPVVGGCEEPCYNCTQVCPTEAIRRISLEEKSFAKIGTARISRERCLAWEELKPCLVCDEVCPYDAVEFRVITDHRGTHRRPLVHVDKCVGCGICEHECPVGEPRAIIVEHYNEERRSTGSYITPKKRQMRRPIDDRDVDYLREYRSTVPAPEYPTTDGPDTLPPGFILD